MLRRLRMPSARRSPGGFEASSLPAAARQPIILQSLQLVMLSCQQCPRLPVPIRPERAHRLGHPRQQLIAELALAAITTRRTTVPPPHAGGPPYGSAPGSRPIDRSPSPRSHTRSTSLILCTPTSRKAVAAFPDPPTLWQQDRAAASRCPVIPVVP